MCIKDTNTLKHTRTHARTHARTHTHTHMHVFVYVCVCVCVCMGAFVCVCARMCVRAYAQLTCCPISERRATPAVIRHARGMKKTWSAILIFLAAHTSPPPSPAGSSLIWVQALHECLEASPQRSPQGDLGTTERYVDRRGRCAQQTPGSYIRKISHDFLKIFEGGFVLLGSIGRHWTRHVWDTAVHFLREVSRILIFFDFCPC